MGEADGKQAGRDWYRRGAMLVAGLLLLGLLTPFLLNNAMQRDISRDEHQFVTPGVLLARDHLLPYKDYPYFHPPYQVALQTLAVKLSDHLLSGARVVSTAFGLGVLGLLFATTLRYLTGLPLTIRLAVALALPFFMAFNTLFLYTNGRAWNHDLSVFLALAAFLVHCAALRAPKPGRRLLASGLLLGLAVGVRLSWAPLALPFLVALYWPGTAAAEPRSWRRGLPFLAGLALAGLPWLPLFLSSPTDNIFGAVIYPGKLTTQFWSERNYGKAMDWAGKLSYFYQHVYLGPGDYHFFDTYRQNKVLFLSTALGALPLNLLGIWRGYPWRRESIFLLLVLPLVWLGAALPTPNMYQYYYQTVPYCLLAWALGLANLLHGIRPLVWPRRLLMAAVLLTALYIVQAAAHVCVFDRDKGWTNRKGTWNATRVHQMGREMARQVSQGRVLTFVPTYPLEGGLDIYPELASGLFAFRVAHLLPPEERRARRMVAAADLERFLAPQPPAAILTGVEKDFEVHLVNYAQSHGYRPRPLPRCKLVLWLPETPAPQGGKP